MTLSEVERMDATTLTPAQVASVLHSDHQKGEKTHDAIGS
nr:MAG TPA: hypothetical protein [Caudoviricetes sp.]